MLNLFSKFVVPGVEHVEIYQDDEDPLQFWMLPSEPSLVVAEDGGPTIALMIFARDLDLMADVSKALPSGETEGGLLDLSIEVAVSPAEQAAILDYVRTRVLTGAEPMVWPRMGGDGGIAAVLRRPTGGTPRLSYPVWMDGTVQFSMMTGEGPTFVKGIAGSQKPSLTGTNIASFEVSLGQEGVRALKQSFESGHLPAVVTYALTHQVRVPQIQIHVWGEASDVYRELKDHVTVVEKQGDRVVRRYPQVSNLQELRDKVASLHVVYDSNKLKEVSDKEHADFDAAIKPIETFVLDIVQGYLTNNFFTPAFSPDLEGKKLGTDPLQNFKPPGSLVTGNNNLWLKDSSQVMTGHFEFKLDGRISFPAPSLPNALLLQLVTREALERRTSYLDLNHPIFHKLDVPVRVTADFSRDPIAGIQVSLDYEQTDERTGTVITAGETFTFNTGDEVFYFRTTLAQNADGTPKDTYRYSSKINFKASASPEFTPAVETRERSLIIGYDGLSFVQVDCVAGDIPWAFVDRVDVRLHYPGLDTPSATGRLSLTAADTAARSWFTYTGGNPSREYEYQLTYSLKDGQKIALEPARETTNRLTVDGPFADRLEVTFVAQGMFPPIKAVVLQVRHLDPAHDYAVDDVHTFDAAAQSWTWTVPIRDKALRVFEYKADVSYTDGSVARGEWRRESALTVDVGEVAERILDVQVVPTVLDMTRWKLVLVRLRYVDPGTGKAQEKTVQFTSQNATEPVTWKVALTDGAARSYSYEVQAWGNDGTKARTGPTTSEDAFLVVEL